VICVSCDLKLEQHHRFIQRVIQNQKKIQGPQGPLVSRITTGMLGQRARIRVTGSTDGPSYPIVAVSSSSSSSSSSESEYDSDADPNAGETAAELIERHRQERNAILNQRTTEMIERMTGNDEEEESSDSSSSGSSGGAEAEQEDEEEETEMIQHPD